MTPGMYRNNKRLSAWLLSALILFGQASVLAHQFGEDILECLDDCVQCLTQSVFDGKAVAAVHTYTILLADAAPQAAVASGYPSRDSSTTNARSPPITPA